MSLEVYGHARPLPAGLDLSAYRIIQEALTNVVKHAGSGARCVVHLGYDDGVPRHPGDRRRRPAP